MESIGTSLLYFAGGAASVLIAALIVPGSTPVSTALGFDAVPQHVQVRIERQAREETADAIAHVLIAADRDTWCAPIDPTWAENHDAVGVMYLSQALKRVCNR